MPITYAFELDDKTLKVKASGTDDTLDEVKQYSVAVIQATIQNGCDRVICDERDLRYCLSTIDTFELARYIVEHVPRVTKVAIVCRAEDTQDAAFFETVASNRGLLIKMFKEPGEAAAWLQD